ncbi:hypothetical protein [Staphylococcus agnetis]|uniref:hypothetical protein n=1 Tax=Staphylococcus agnetis TaxID=985762 RepID=UPI0014312ED5|nr:hypothetical protein [Staphylococcus agnetis]NJH67210.1 hypothetical protein [Staphylococcus agnetis]
MQIYNNLKPIVIFIISIMIVFLLSKYTFFTTFINFLTKSPLKASRDFIIDSMVTLLIFLISIVVFIIECKITKIFSKLTIQILNENQQSGDTPLFIDKEDEYKMGFLKLTLRRKGANFPKGSSEIRIKFPKGVCVDWEDYSSMFKENENELLLDLKNVSLTNESSVTIPFQYNVISNKIGQNQNIEIEYDLKECFTKCINRGIEIKRR